MSSLTNQTKGEIFDDSNYNYNSALASASIIGSNIDIITLILSRLPSKSLLVFKSVSKQWLSIITQPQFVHKHFIQNPKLSIAGIFYYDDSFQVKKPTYYYISLDGNTNRYVPFETQIFPEDKFVVKIVHSCNGLVILCGSCLSSIICTFYIFNPFTNKHKSLTQSQLISSPWFRNSISLAFDPFKSPYYKVIAIWQTSSRSCYKYKIEIYDSETSSWRLSGLYTCTPRHESMVRWRSSILWNGSLYWCHIDGDMVYFDIDQELVGVLPNPVQEHDCKKWYDIAQYGGHFYFIEQHRNDRFSFNIFERDAAYSTWNSKGRVDMRLNPYAQFPGSRNSYANDYIIFIIETKEEKESTKVVLLTNESMVVSYDLKYRCFEKISDLSAKHEFRGGVSIHQNIESLAGV